MISLFEEGSQAAPSQAAQQREPSWAVFDIETGPAPADVIAKHEPEFEAPGNYKDPVKIQAVIDEKRAAFASKAALSPMTGRVLAIGVWLDDGFGYRSAIVNEDSEDEEKSVIEWFWGLLSKRTVVIGFNSNKFDFPFLIKRSWALGIAVPVERIGLTGYSHRDRSLDLHEVWQLGDRTSYTSLDSVSKYLGVGEKSGDGEFFHKVLKAFPDEAAEYLENDVRLTFEVAKKLDVIKSDVDFDSSPAAEPEPASKDEDY